MISFISNILPLLQNEDYYAKFKFIKGQTSFRQKTDFGFHNIEFYLHKSFDLARDRPALEIRPVYGVRFDKVVNWFEQFSLKSLTDQRNNPTVMADGKTLKAVDKFYFLDSGIEFDKDFNLFARKTADISKDYFSKYKSLDDYFLNDVMPILNMERKMNDVGVDWIFEYLAAVKLCNHDRFAEMTAILRDQIEFMKSRQEPNVASYYDKFEVIFDELRRMELK